MFVAAFLVFVAALILRLAHLDALQSAWEGTRLFSLARVDAGHHWRIAQLILDQDFWLSQRVFWKGPGYSYFLALLMELVGREPAALRWPLAVLGSLNCAALVLLARRLLPWPWATVAGLVAATNGIVLLFDGELYFPTLLIALNLPALWLLTLNRVGARESMGAGALLGAAALVHPVYLLPAATVSIPLARESRRTALTFLMGVVVVVAPLSVRNFVVHDQPLLISGSGGVNLYVGNQPAFDQGAGQSTTSWARVLATPRDAGLRSESEIDRTYTRLALRQMVDFPNEAAKILLTKARLLFSPVEIANNFRIYEMRELSPVLAATLGRWGPLWLPFGLLAPLALIGLWGSWRRSTQPRELTPILVAWSVGLALSILISFNTARYRVPLIFFGSIWVAWSLRAGWTLAAGRQWSRLVAGTVGFFALVVLVAAAAQEQRTLPPPYEWDQVRVLEAEGRGALAERWAARARRSHPDDPVLALALARFHGRRGQFEQQEELLEAILAQPGIEPDLRSQSLEEQGRSLLARRRLDEARESVLAALDLHVDDTLWRGEPYYRMKLVPSTSCRLRLLLATIELWDGARERASELVESVQDDCPDSESLRPQMEELRNQLGGRDRGAR